MEIPGRDHLVDCDVGKITSTLEMSDSQTYVLESQQVL